MTEMAGVETVATPSLTFLTWMVGEMAIPCDFSHELHCNDDPAEWVLHRVPCCEKKVNAALACEGCKEARLMDALALECENCGTIFEHAPDAYFLIEPINKKRGRA